MDDVSSIKFDYQILRQPNKQSKNVFEYAAFLCITYENKKFLTIDDVCIVDFIYKLSQYNLNLNIYEFIPIDSKDKVLIFKKIDSEKIEITSDWTNNIIVVKQDELLCSIKLLKLKFEKDTKVNINKYYE